MKKVITLMVVSLSIMIMSLLPMVVAAPGGATTDLNNTQRGSGTSSTTVDIEGGNVTLVNVSGTQITGRWAGFYGNISGGLQLSDSSSNIFYEWTVSDVTGAVVYAANGTVSAWASVAAARESDMPAYLAQGSADNYNNTFANSETFNSASISVTNVNFTNTWQSGTQGTLRTHALVDTDGDIIFAGTAQDDVTGFEGVGTVDYQLLVPANATVETYNFYLELP